MRTLATLSLTVLIIFAACKRSETQTSQTQQQMKQNPPPAPPAAKPAGQGIKWPLDYPAGGDSVAVIAVSIDGHPAGEMIAEFYPDKAPNHVRNFKWLANSKFYDGVKFHRIIKGFMIQGGDPTGTGGGGPGWQVNAEFNDIKHTKGILSMARSSDPNSAGSQFFLMDSTSTHLDGQYTVFGKVIKGIEVEEKIAAIPTTAPNGMSPAKNAVMTSVRIVARSSVKL